MFEPVRIKVCVAHSLYKNISCSEKLLTYSILFKVCLKSLQILFYIFLQKKISDMILNEMIFIYGPVVRFRRDSILILEFLYESRMKGLVSRYFVGSAGEGTAHAQSDVDKLMVRKGILICQSNEEANEKDGIVFSMDTTDCHPGYTKLKLIKNEKKDDLPIDSYDPSKDIMGIFEKKCKGDYLSNKEIIEWFLNFLGNTGSNVTTKLYRNGPCATGEFMTYYVFARNINPNTDCDFAQGFEICGITKEGEQWLQTMKERTGFWPPIEIIEKIEALKCHVVAVGDNDDKISDSHLKWRISYTLWERELIWSFNDVQLHCLIILKVLLAKKMKMISEDVSSFHMKNIVLWESMEHSLKAIESTRLLYLLRNCLTRLLESIKLRRLEHFIDKHRNLFESKFKDDDARKKLMDYISKELIESTNIVPVILECIGKEKLKEILDSCRSEPDKFLEKAYEVSDWAAVGIEKVKTYTQIYKYGMDILAVKNDVLIVITDMVADLYLDENFLNKMDELDVDNNFVQIVKNIILSRYAMYLAPISPDLNKKWGLDDSEMRKSLERYTDALSGRLYQCTDLIRNNKYLKAKDIMEEFLASGPKLIIYCGFCSNYLGINVEKNEVKHVSLRLSSLELPEKSFPFAHDVTINQTDIDFFLSAIQIQSSLEKTFSINPIMYMYYLQVLCDMNLNGNADQSLTKLRETYHQCKLEKGNFRHLNILGHAYFLTGYYEKSYTCFLASINDPCSEEATNSVFYLLLLLIYHLIY